MKFIKEIQVNTINLFRIFILFSNLTKLSNFVQFYGVFRILLNFNILNFSEFVSKKFKD